MRIKFECTFVGIRLARDGEYKLEFLAPLVEISNAVSVIRTLNKRFMIALVTEGQKNKFDDVGLHRVAIDSDGETKVVLSIPYESMSNVDLACFGRYQQKNITVHCKIGQSSDSQEEKEE